MIQCALIRCIAIRGSGTAVDVVC
eukprot:COSAG06_NODE_36909_length_441_cov_1.368421_1_plen_23_part_01